MDDPNTKLSREELKQRMKNRLNQSQKNRSSSHAKAFAELKHDKWVEQQKESQDQDTAKVDNEN